MLAIPWAPPFNRYRILSARHSLGSSFRQLFLLYSKCLPFPGPLILTDISILEALAIPWAPPFDRYFAARSASHSLGSSFLLIFRCSKCSPLPGLLLLTGISLLEVLAFPWAPPFDKYFATRSARHFLGSSFRQAPVTLLEQGKVSFVVEDFRELLPCTCFP